MRVPRRQAVTPRERAEEIDDAFYGGSANQMLDWLEDMGYVLVKYADSHSTYVPATSGSEVSTLYVSPSGGPSWTAGPNIITGWPDRAPYALPVKDGSFQTDRVDAAWWVCHSPDAAVSPRFDWPNVRGLTSHFLTTDHTVQGTFVVEVNDDGHSGGVWIHMWQIAPPAVEIGGWLFNTGVSLGRTGRPV